LERHGAARRQRIFRRSACARTCAIGGTRRSSGKNLGARFFCRVFAETIRMFFFFCVFVREDCLATSGCGSKGGQIDLKNNISEEGRRRRGSVRSATHPTADVSWLGRAGTGGCVGRRPPRGFCGRRRRHVGPEVVGDCCVLWAVLARAPDPSWSRGWRFWVHHLARVGPRRARGAGAGGTRFGVRWIARKSRRPMGPRGGAWSDHDSGPRGREHRIVGRWCWANHCEWREAHQASGESRTAGGPNGAWSG